MFPFSPTIKINLFYSSQRYIWKSARTIQRDRFLVTKQIAERDKEKRYISLGIALRLWQYIHTMMRVISRRRGSTSKKRRRRRRRSSSFGVSTFHSRYPAYIGRFPFFRFFFFFNNSFFRDLELRNGRLSILSQRWSLKLNFRSGRYSPRTTRWPYGLGSRFPFPFSECMCRNTIATAPFVGDRLFHRHWVSLCRSSSIGDWAHSRMCGRSSLR